METHAPFVHVHPYMKKGHSIKVDVLSRQAQVSPIFIKPQILPISDRYVRVYDPLINNLESRSDENYIIETKLYDKYKSIFNNISRESLINYSIRKSDEITKDTPLSESSSNTCDTTSTNTETTKSDYVESLDNNEFNKILDSNEFISYPWVSVVPHMVKSMFKSVINEEVYMSTLSEHPFTDYTYDSIKISKIDVKTPEQISEPDVVRSPNYISESNQMSGLSETSRTNGVCEPSKGFLVNEKCVRRLSSALTSFIKELDYWNNLVADSLSRTGSSRLTLSEARVFINDYRYITFGLLNSELSNRLENEIKIAEHYSNKVRQKLSSIFDKESEESCSIDLSVAENLLKEGSLLTFSTPEFISLSHLFYSVASLRNLLDESILRSDITNSNTLIEECDNSVIKIPDLENVKLHLSKIMWLNNAQKYSHKSVNYKLVVELIDNTPEELKSHTLYQNLKNKVDMAFKLIEKLKEPKFKYLTSTDELRINNQNKDKNIEKIVDKDKIIDKEKIMEKDSDSEDETSDEEEISVENGIEMNKKLKPEELEDIHNNYQEINLIIPSFKNIEPAYFMWKRFQRRLRKVEALISSENSANCTIECLVLLQQAETLKEYIDIDNVLEPINSDVENSLKFEKKCRNLLNRFNNWSITNDFIKFKTEWNSLNNFRKNATVNKKDLQDLINLVNLYNNRETVESDNQDSKTENIVKDQEDELVLLKPKIKRRKSMKRLEKSQSEKGSDSVDDEDKDKSTLSTNPPEITREKVDFQEIVELFNEFWKLRVKNWQIFRNLEEIHNSCLDLIDKAENIIKDLKQGLRSEEVFSSLILITIETLKFGANLHLDKKLLNSVKYCLWIKKLYISLNKLYNFLTSNENDSNSELEIKADKVYTNREMNIEADESSSKSDEVSIPSEESNSDSEDVEIEHENNQLKVFVRRFKSLGEEFDKDSMEEFVDSTHPISFYINITQEQFNKVNSTINKITHTNDNYEKLLESQKIFTLTEEDFIREFTTQQYV
ncbi:uncharacterized protein TA06615 [Theileria annulata]|uniref:Lysine-specific demethylase-like domain-containing protein n=1 Tax=Theileria annulata TaxID=5874 RepID=Q4UIF2_THEAN|nr:uncharacterized protein TA06615 [Theileria annulata]CAI73137.1 hypothetical protein, conserved [Theileria annulata]|eukprot:XP_953815.1 hypothetical protein, conserved [Theileria annulata]